MRRSREILQETALGGLLSGALSTVALAWLGQRNGGMPAAPLNAVSHWIFGDCALHEDRPTLRHTLTGVAIHCGASVFWAAAHAAAWSRLRQPGDGLPQEAVRAAMTSVLAAFVDYRLTPRRLTPGFEHRLSLPQMAAVYGTFGLGMALAGTLLRDAPRRGRRIVRD